VRNYWDDLKELEKTEREGLREPFRRLRMLLGPKEQPPLDPLRHYKERPEAIRLEPDCVCPEFER
jgi:hypothetical protein